MVRSRRKVVGLASGPLVERPGEKAGDAGGGAILARREVLAKLSDRLDALVMVFSKDRYVREALQTARSALDRFDKALNAHAEASRTAILAALQMIRSPSSVSSKLMAASLAR